MLLCVYLRASLCCVYIPRIAVHFQNICAEFQRSNVLLVDGIPSAPLLHPINSRATRASIYGAIQLTFSLAKLVYAKICLTCCCF